MAWNLTCWLILNLLYIGHGLLTFLIFVMSAPWLHAYLTGLRQPRGATGIRSLDILVLLWLCCLVSFQMICQRCLPGLCLFRLSIYLFSFAFVESDYLSLLHCQIRKIVGCACAGNAGNVFPAIAGSWYLHASQHVRHACAVMHAGIAN